MNLKNLRFFYYLVNEIVNNEYFNEDRNKIRPIIYYINLGIFQKLF